jgi:hypothetical protein
MPNHDGKVAGDMHVALELFENICWLHIADVFRPGRLVREESAYGESKIDTELGIDWWHILRNGERRGLAVRVQDIKPDWPPYNTFSIRTTRRSGGSTELSKRLRQIERDELRPQFTVQVYLRRREFLSAGVVKSDVLYLFAKEHLDQLLTYQNRQGRGDADFVAVSWDFLDQRGCKVRRR